MIEISVENMSIDVFLVTISTRRFYDVKEFDKFISDFFEHYKKQVITTYKKGEAIREKCAQKEKERLFNEHYQAEIAKIEDVMFRRGEYFKRIQHKIDYPPEKYKRMLPDMEKPKVTGVHHVGIGVRDIEISRNFYLEKIIL